MPEEINNLRLVYEAGMTVSDPQLLDCMSDKAPGFIVPAGAQLVIPKFEDVEKWANQPVRTKGTFKFSTVESFIRYFNEHKRTPSRVFASVNDAGGHFRGVLNFHGEEEPNWGDHIAIAELLPTHEWKLWMAANKKSMNQGEFAQFLEENAEMFTEPKGADLLELILSLEGRNHADIKEAFKLQSGAIKVNYTEEVVLKGVASNREGNIELPSILKVAIAPFEGVANYEVTARLRYRINDRRLTFWYETANAHLVIRSVTADLVQTITKQTGVEPFRV